MPRFLRLFRELPLPEIEPITAPKGSDLGSTKDVLADEVTRLVHGADAAVDEPVPDRGFEGDRSIPESGAGPEGSRQPLRRSVHGC